MTQVSIPESVSRYVEARIERVPRGCWEWTGYRNSHGYGIICSNHGRIKRGYRAHRLVYEIHVGEIPDGMTLDHLCRNRGCVNPKHLEPVSNRENILRGEGWTAQQARKTHCVHGHEFTPENTYVNSQGHRKCRVCRRIRMRQRVFD